MVFHNLMSAYTIIFIFSQMQIHDPLFLNVESVYHFTKLFILLVHFYFFLVIRSIKDMKHSVSKFFVKINTIWYAFVTFFVNICHAEYVIFSKESAFAVIIH